MKETKKELKSTLILTGICSLLFIINSVILIVYEEYEHNPGAFFTIMGFTVLLLISFAISIKDYKEAE